MTDTPFCQEENCERKASNRIDGVEIGDDVYYVYTCDEHSN